MRQNRPTNPSGVPSWVLPAVLAALIVLGGAIFAGYELGKKSSNGSAATATATSSPVPTPAASTNPGAPATPAKSATISPSATPTSAATPGATVTPGTTKTPPDVRAVQAAAIRARGYNPRGYAYSDFGPNDRLWGWKATCQNSADHYCQKIFFFHNATLLGTDTSGGSRLILAFRGTGGRPPAIRVKYADFRPGDPDCCASGTPVWITYTWNGSTMTASGTPPR